MVAFKLKAQLAELLMLNLFSVSLVSNFKTEFLHTYQELDQSQTQRQLEDRKRVCIFRGGLKV